MTDWCQLGAQLDVTSLLYKCRGLPTLRSFLYPALSAPPSNGFESIAKAQGHRKDAFEKLGEAFDLQELQWLALLHQRRAGVLDSSTTRKSMKGNPGSNLTRGRSGQASFVAESSTIPAYLGFYQNVSIACDSSSASILTMPSICSSDHILRYEFYSPPQTWRLSGSRKDRLRVSLGEAPEFVSTWRMLSRLVGRSLQRLCGNVGTEKRTDCVGSIVPRCWELTMLLAYGWLSWSTPTNP